MAVKLIKGNIFSSKAQVLVNTVNCVGVMGAGLALECRLRYPDMYVRYVEFCEGGSLKPGILWIYKTDERWILNFPTKNHWKYPSKESYLRSGLQKFVNTYKDRGIESIAFPLLGADKGGLNKETSLGIMQEYLSDLDIDIEIYEYDPSAYDDTYLELKELLLNHDIEHLIKISGIQKNYLIKVIDTIQNKDIYQVNQLAATKGVGIKTMERLFAVMRDSQEQSTLF